MYVHKSCALKEHELDMGKRAGGICHQCGQQGTIYHVKGTADYFEYVLFGVLYKMVEGEAVRPDQEVVDVESAKVRAERKRKKGESIPITVDTIEEEFAMIGANITIEPIVYEIEAETVEEEYVEDEEYMALSTEEYDESMKKKELAETKSTVALDDMDIDALKALLAKREAEAEK